MQQQRVELAGRDSLQRFASCTLMIAKNVQKLFHFISRLFYFSGSKLVKQMLQEAFISR